MQNWDEFLETFALETPVMTFKPCSERRVFYHYQELTYVELARKTCLLSNCSSTQALIRTGSTTVATVRSSLTGNSNSD